MPQWSLNTKNFPRRNNFPFRVEKIFHCHNMSISTLLKEWDCVEVCLRISAKSVKTEDIINGRYIKSPCPNVAWRLPGVFWQLPSTDVRDAIAFCYSSEVLKTMEILGMKIENTVSNFIITSELENLIAKFHRTLNNLYTPGAADMLDWICFSIMINLKLQENIEATPDQSLKKRIFNVSLWFQMHFAESIDIEKVAAANGFSHDHFFKSWKKYFDMTPVRYINDLRLEAAAHRLLESNLSISAIIQEVHFAGEYMFYKSFRQKYGMTPREYRELNRKI